MVWMGLSLLNQSPPEEHLDCFQFGATTNKIAKFEYKFCVNMKFSFHLDKWPRMQSLDGSC